jgi:S-adenosylmethionine:diacylglycerol 3-amino-3-carboxypropyl transferase
MCCAILALTMTLLTGWRSVSRTLDGRSARVRRTAIVVIAIGAAAGSATATDRFAVEGRAPSRLTRLDGMPICGGHFIR